MPPKSQRPHEKQPRVLATFADQPGKEFWRGKPRNPVLDPEIAHAMALAEEKEIRSREELEKRYLGKLATARQLYGDDAETKPLIQELKARLDVPLQDERDAAAEKVRSSHAIHSYKNSVNGYHMYEVVRVPVEPTIGPAPGQTFEQPAGPAPDQQPQ